MSPKQNCDVRDERRMRCVTSRCARWRRSIALVRVAAKSRWLSLAEIVAKRYVRRSSVTAELRVRVLEVFPSALRCRELYDRKKVSCCLRFFSPGATQSTPAKIEKNLAVRRCARVRQ